MRKALLLVALVVSAGCGVSGGADLSTQDSNELQVITDLTRLEASVSPDVFEISQQELLLDLGIELDETAPDQEHAADNAQSWEVGELEVADLLWTPDEEAHDAQYEVEVWDVASSNGPDSFDAEAESTGPGDVWADPASGLEWQRVSPFEAMNWDQAQSHCASLELAGGGWHLPAVDELRSLIRDCPDTVTGGECNVGSAQCLLWQCRGDSCIGCPFGGGNGLAGCYWPLELSGKCASYWAANDMEDKPELAWHIGFQGAYISPTYKTAMTHVRCVRQP